MGQSLSTNYRLKMDMLEKAKFLKENYKIESPFLQELIWFHRIKPDQDKNMLALEFLNVCRWQSSENSLFEDKHFIVKHRKDIALRTVLYNFPELEELLKSNLPEKDLWEEAEKLLQQKLSNETFDFSYLKNNFDSFDTFYRSIKLMRDASIGVTSAKRWTSKFIHPFSFDALFRDMDNKNESFTNDRRFFSRGGEVLYLMVTRGRNSDQLRKLIENIFLKPTQNMRWDNLLKALRGKHTSKPEGKCIGFLQVKSHAVFDALVGDLTTLMNSNIPHSDIFQHLSSISAFYFIHYMLTIATERLGKSLVKDDVSKVVYPLEVLASRSDHVRKASRQYYKMNEDLPKLAINYIFEDYFKSIELLDIDKDREEIAEKLNCDLNFRMNEEFSESATINQIKTPEG